MIVSELAYDDAAAGRRAEARKLLAELQARSNREYIDPYPLAWVYVALGENENALRSLEKAYEVKSSWMPWIKVEPKFDQLHSEPRFKALVEKLGLDKPVKNSTSARYGQPILIPFASEQCNTKNSLPLPESSPRRSTLSRLRRPS